MNSFDKFTKFLVRENVLRYVNVVYLWYVRIIFYKTFIKYLQYVLFYFQVCTFRAIGRMDVILRVLSDNQTGF